MSQTASSISPSTPQTPVSKRVLIASLIGSSIEWFDYFLYGTVAALVFNQLFFPTVDRNVGTMLAFASFALSFFIRPFGGIIFSHIGDKIGRKKTLVATLSLMGGATVLMGLLPTYEAIGLGIIWAPITAVLGTMFSEIFNSNVRYTGITLGYQIGAALAGGTAPLVATYLLTQFDKFYTSIAVYIVLTGIISLLAISAVKDYSGKAIDNA